MPTLKRSKKRRQAWKCWMKRFCRSMSNWRGKGSFIRRNYQRKSNRRRRPKSFTRLSWILRKWLTSRNFRKHQKHFWNRSKIWLSRSKDWRSLKSNWRKNSICIQSTMNRDNWRRKCHITRKNPGWSTKDKIWNSILKTITRRNYHKYKSNSRPQSSNCYKRVATSEPFRRNTQDYRKSWKRPSKVRTRWES